MKLAATIAGSIRANFEAELRQIARAVPAGIREAGEGLKGALRRQVVSAGLGPRLARTWRSRHYPNRHLDAASLVWSKAPQIVRTFGEGAVIRSGRGLWLAIPTPAAPKRGVGGKRISPATFPEHRFGKLRFIYRPRGASLLVVDGVRASYSRKSGTLRGFRKASERARRTGAGLATVVMFVLVPQVRIRKRLDVERVAQQWAARTPALIDRHLT